MTQKYLLSPRTRHPLPLAAAPIYAGPATGEAGEELRMLDVNHHITRGREGYLAFTVTGDSMVDRIHPHDIVFVDSWAEPQHGEIVAAVVNGGVCVKIFERPTPRRLYLVSANGEQYPPREITPQDDFRILGVVRGHLTVYHGGRML